MFHIPYSKKVTIKHVAAIFGKNIVNPSLHYKWLSQVEGDIHGEV